MTEWRDVKTDPPPRDSSVIIYCSERYDGELMVGLAYLSVSGTWHKTEGGFHRVEPTYWMPLPEPPPRSNE